jgi:hypothetical protein
VPGPAPGGGVVGLPPMFTDPTLGWSCDIALDGSAECFNPFCVVLDTGDFGCSGGAVPVPPGGSPPDGWQCFPDENGAELCTGYGAGPDLSDGYPFPSYAVNPNPVGSGCLVPNQTRWCEGVYYGGWGQQLCYPMADGTWNWTQCVESGTIPNTDCACNYSALYEPDCCDAVDCSVVSEIDPTASCVLQ